MTGDVERLIARLLFAGGVLGIAVAAVGLAVYTVGGGLGGDGVNVERLLAARAGGRPAAVFVSVGAIVRGLTHPPVDPLALIALGLLLLLLTPVLGVAAAIPAFLVARDYRYVAISSLVLLALLAGLALGAVG
jgi:uncharacterized membrane protein